MVAEKKAEAAIDSRPNQMQQLAHIGPGIVKGLKKFQNVKLQTFIERLYDMNVHVDRFAQEIEAFFLHHSIRKTRIVQQIQEQIADEKGKQMKIIG